MTVTLVIDDEPTVRRIARRTLEPAVCTVAEAADGEEGLRIIEGGDPPVDLVLTDLVMPGLDGWDVIETLARHRPELPVVAMSGWIGGGDARLRSYGLEFLAKPFGPEQLKDTVAAVLERARRMQALAARQRSSARLAQDNDARIRTGDLEVRGQAGLVKAAWEIHQQRLGRGGSVQRARPDRV